jgi:hypothetical protein
MSALSARGVLIRRSISLGMGRCIQKRTKPSKPRRRKPRKPRRRKPRKPIGKIYALRFIHDMRYKKVREIKKHQCASCECVGLEKVYSYVTNDIYKVLGS